MIVTDKAKADLGWPTLLAHWAKRCGTERGAAAVLHHPWFATVAEAQLRATEIQQARELAVRDAAIATHGIADVAVAIDRVTKAGTLDAVELLAVAKTARTIGALRKHLRTWAETAPALALYAESLADLGHVYVPILEGFDSDGRLVDHASDALGPLRRAAAALTQQLERRMKAMLEDERYAPYLQDSYYTERQERYVLPVRTDGKGFVRGIVHGTSGSGQTLFIEPEEIVELNNKKKLAECEVADEERRILARYSGWVAEEAAQITLSLATAETLDVIAAAARMAEDVVASAPVIVEAPMVALLHARHPLMLLAERRCVANDIKVGAGQTMIISGPNAGGKTVSLKTIGLTAMMVRCGLHVAAEAGSTCGWFTRLVTDIGDAQSLEQNLSTFSGHMLNLTRILADSGPGSLVLLDEIAVGTDPEQGAVLAEAVITALAAQGVTALITTHYERLKVLAVDDPRFQNASVGFDLARLEPTFKLALGVPGASGALAVARRMGMPQPIVARAEALLGKGTYRVDALLANVAEQRRQLELERAAVLAELDAVEAERASLRAQRERIVAKYDKQARSAHGEAMTALKSARRDLDALRKQLRERMASIATLGAAASVEQEQHAVRELERAVSAVSHEVAKHEPAPAALPTAALTSAQLIPGTPVVVTGIGKGQTRGVIDGAPVDGRVAVRMGRLRAMVELAAVRLDSHRAARRAAELLRQEATPDKPDGLPPVVLIDGANDGRATARTREVTLDVRGQRLDDALALVDRFIDEGLIVERDTLFVVHGHGTGTLKKAVRAFASGHKAVKLARAGHDGEGGDGVTVLLLA